jgi:hypothetical protein
MATLVEILAALDELPAIVSIIRRLEGQMTDQASVIAQIDDMTNKFGATINAMAADVSSVADRITGLQGAITSGNQAAVQSAMASLAPELDKFGALSDRMTQVGNALHTLASDPNNPTDAGTIPPGTLVGGQDSASAGTDTSTSAPQARMASRATSPTPATGGEQGTTTADTGGPVTVDNAGNTVPPQDTETGSTGGTVNPQASAPVQDATGAGAQPDVTGPTDTAVGGAADATTGTAGGMPTGGTVDTSQAGGGVGSQPAAGEETGGTTP